MASSNSFKTVSKLFETLCNHQNPYRIWNDAMTIYATMIANSVDFSICRKEHEQLYLDTVKPYTQEELRAFAQIFAEIVKILDENPFQDCLGTMYMELGIGNKNTGQFFTPYHLSQLMAESMVTKEVVAKELKETGYLTLNEPACGAGANLIAACEVLHKMGVDYQRKVFIVAQDVDSTVASMCYVQLSLIGCVGYVRIGDTLRNPITAPLLVGERNPQTWYTPMWYRSEWTEAMFIDAIRQISRWRADG